MIENQDRRVLGALRLVDAATGAVLRQPFQIDAPPGVRLIRNLSGYYVIAAAPGFEAYTGRFENQPEERVPGPSDAGALPFASAALTFKVGAAGGDYLPRLATCQLPRASNLPRPGEVLPAGWQPGPLFSPIDIPLFRSSSSGKEPNWAVIYASIQNAATRAPLTGALVRVLRTAPEPVASGLADGRGEAMVAIAGLPRITWPDNDTDSTVLVTEFDATLEVVWDRNGGATVDPGVLERDRLTFVHQSFPMKLAAGRTTGATLLVNVP